jgi:hypothetical protein
VRRGVRRQRRGGTPFHVCGRARVLRVCWPTSRGSCLARQRKVPICRDYKRDEGEGTRSGCDQVGILRSHGLIPDDPLSVERGSLSRPLRQRSCGLCRDFVDRRDRVLAREVCRKASQDVAMRRAYRRCVRNVSACSTNRQQQKCPFAGTLSKPSDGLEPSTPSLPWRFWGVTRVHARSLATQFFLQIDLIRRRTMRRETLRVSFLMCPFCVRAELFS